MSAEQTPEFYDPMKLRADADAALEEAKARPDIVTHPSGIDAYTASIVELKLDGRTARYYDVETLDRPDLFGELPHRRTLSTESSEK